MALLHECSPQSDAARSYTLGGSKSLAGVLNMIRFTTTTGADTFDGGKINIAYHLENLLRSIIRGARGSLNGANISSNWLVDAGEDNTLRDLARLERGNSIFIGWRRFGERDKLEKNGIWFASCCFVCFSKGKFDCVQKCG